MAVPSWAVELVPMGIFQLSYTEDGFGGLSGLWISPDGSDMVAVTDRGRFLEGRITRKDDKIDQVTIDRFEYLPGRDAPKLADLLRDAEGLAIAPDGTRFVSFEGNPRVWRYDTFTTRPEWTHKWDRFWDLQFNSGLEALAIDAEGSLYAIPERSGQWERPFPVYRLKNGVWDQTLSVPREGKFLVVGADFGPDGMFYLLERQFEWLGGFRNRIRRFELDANGFGAGETLLETRFRGYDNLEGISVWKNAEDQIMITMVSDDNFSFFQSTQLVEFAIKP